MQTVREKIIGLAFSDGDEWLKALEEYCEEHEIIQLPIELCWNLNCEV